MRLYDNEVNRELVEAEDEEDDEKGGKLDFVEICKAGGKDIKYKVSPRTHTA